MSTWLLRLVSITGVVAFAASAASATPTAPAKASAAAAAAGPQFVNPNFEAQYVPT